MDQFKINQNEDIQHLLSEWYEAIGYHLSNTNSPSIMAVPISNEQRSNGAADMEDVIQKDERLLFEDVHL